MRYANMGWWAFVCQPSYFSSQNDTDMFYCPSATRHVEAVGEWGNDTAWYFDSGMGTDHGSDDRISQLPLPRF